MRHIHIYIYINKHIHKQTHRETNVKQILGGNIEPMWVVYAYDPPYKCH